MKKLIVILLLILMMANVVYASDNESLEVVCDTVDYLYAPNDIHYLPSGAWLNISMLPEDFNKLETLKLEVNYDPEIVEFTQEMTMNENCEVSANFSEVGRLTITLKRKGLLSDNNELVKVVSLVYKPHKEGIINFEVKIIEYQTAEVCDVSLEDSAMENIIVYDINKLEPKLIWREKSELHTIWESYDIIMQAENMYNLKHLELVLSYNTDVLDFEFGGSDLATPEYYKGKYSFEEIEEGKIRIIFETPDAHLSEMNGEYYLRFKVKAYGDCGFDINVVQKETLHGLDLLVDTEQFDLQIKEPPYVITTYENGILSLYPADDLLSIKHTTKIKYDNPVSLYGSIKITEGFEYIGKYALKRFTHLTDIWLPENELTIEDEFAGKLVTLHGKSMSWSEAFAGKYAYKFIATDECLKGDIDKNELITVRDALSILRMVAKLDAMYPYTADVDGNGMVDATDALSILMDIVNQ